MSKFLNSKFSQLVPYTPGLQPTDRTFVKLNTNESPYPPPKNVVDAAANAAKILQLYPDPSAKKLTQKLAETLGILPENILLGNGSDELLAYCFMALCENGAVFPDITYSFYPVWANLYGVQYKTIPLTENFLLQTAEYAKEKGTLFIANPNAPTGIALHLPKIEELLVQNTNRLVIIDEAYADFSEESTTTLLDKYHNLVVTGTFSKSRQMAGARLGWLASSKEIICDLEKIHHSFNSYTVNRMTQAAGLASLENEEYFSTCKAQIIQTRNWILQELPLLGFTVTQSKANFIFCKHNNIDGEVVYKSLYDAGILVRWWNTPLIKDWLRITMGTPQEMEQLQKELQKIIEKECG